MQKQYKRVKDIFDVGRTSSLLDKGLSLFVPAVLGVSLAHSVWGIINDRDYAQVQCAVSVAGLGYCIKKRYEPEYKKTGKILKYIFSEKNAHLGWGSFWFVDSHFPMIDKIYAGRRSKIDQNYHFEMTEWGPILAEIKRVMWKNIIEFALYNNMERGMGIKESVLSSIHFIVNDIIGEKLTLNILKRCVKKERFDNVFKLKMCQEVYQTVENCSSDEAVLSFLKKGITNKNSLFKNIDFYKKAEAFFNRAPYDAGKRKMINAMAVGEYASMTGFVASATIMGVNALGASFGVLTLGFLLARMRFSNQNLSVQRARYQNLLGGLKVVEPVECFEWNGMISWRQIETCVTKVQAAKLVDGVYKEAVSFLEKNPNLPCEKSANYLYIHKVLMNPLLRPIVLSLENGLTLEQTVKQYGFEAVHKAMIYDTIVGVLKNMKGYAVRSFLFELKMNELKQDEELKCTENKMKLTVGNRLRYINNLFQKGYLSLEEQERCIRNIFIEETKVKTLCVPKNTQIPRIIEKIKTDSKQQAKD